MATSMTWTRTAHGLASAPWTIIPTGPGGRGRGGTDGFIITYVDAPVMHASGLWILRYKSVKSALTAVRRFVRRGHVNMLIGKRVKSWSIPTRAQLPVR